jgi:hypothetical protein
MNNNYLFDCFIILLSSIASRTQLLHWMHQTDYLPHFMVLTEVGAEQSNFFKGLPH